MRRNKHSGFLVYLNFILIVFLFLWGLDSANAFTLGNTYDKSNWKEIESLLPPSILNWVKKGEFTIPTGKVDFDLKLDEKYALKSQENEGKYDIDKDGSLVKKTGGKPDFVMGNPFPTIDVKDPKAGAKILENFKFTIHYRMGGSRSQGFIRWVGKRGLEREAIADEAYLFYFNRPRGPIPNPNNYSYQFINSVVKPMDLKGTIQMVFTYNDERADPTYAYIPMLRRLRQMAASTRSDPFLGSDFCVDDLLAWAGKNGSLNLKLIGEKTLLMPFSSTKTKIIKRNPDGSIERQHDVPRYGYETPGWKGALWAPVDVTWAPRPVWIVEAIPKDPYYNYGKIIFYLDKENYVIYCKVQYDKAGEYWKTLLGYSSCQQTTDGEKYIGLLSGLINIDDRTQHASITSVQRFPGVMDRFNLRVEDFGPFYFTESNVRELSK